MSDRTGNRRRESFAALWPWPGNIFLVLLAGWLFYMGGIASMEDVKTAFTGLGIVTIVTLMLGLRAAMLRPRRAREPRRPRRALAAVADEPLEPLEPAPMRPEPLGFEAPVAPRPEPRGLETAARSNVTPIFGAPSASEREDADEALLELEGAINRERADRGVQLVRIDQQIAALAARLERAQGSAGDPSALEERIRALEAGARDRTERQEFASLASRLGLLEKRAAAEAPDLAGVMRVQAFNNVVNERLIPRMHQMIANALKARDAGGDAVAELRQAAETARAAHAALEGEVQVARDVANRALKLSRARPTAEAGPGVAEDIAALRAGQEVDRREIAELKAALAARGDAPDASGGGIKRRVAALEAALERFAGAEAALAEVRDALSALGERAGRAEAGGREALRRIDALAGQGEAAEPPTDVAALRDALTTIIEQNRELRAQQERLSARFDNRDPIER